MPSVERRITVENMNESFLPALGQQQYVTPYYRAPELHFLTRLAANDGAPGET